MLAGCLCCGVLLAAMLPYVSPPFLLGEGVGGRQRKRGLKPGAKAKPGQCPGLRVPVIATANDAYAPCLRPLRDVAAIYHFKPPGPDRLMSRLAAITAAERLAMDRQVRYSAT